MSRFNIGAFAADLSAIIGRLVTISEARAVRRDLARHQTIQEQYCSEDMSDERRARVEARERGVERRLVAFFGRALRSFNGDPRGATVKLDPTRIPNDTRARLNYFERDWGGDLIFTGGK